MAEEKKTKKASKPKAVKPDKAREAMAKACDELDREVRQYVWSRQTIEDRG